MPKEESLYNRHLSDGSYGGCYGIELIADLHGCDKILFTEKRLLIFLSELVKRTKMTAHGPPVVWEDRFNSEEHIQGISVFQFIKTSNIVIHALDLTGLLLLNFFTCKDFDVEETKQFILDFFQPTRSDIRVIRRGQTD